MSTPALTFEVSREALIPGSIFRADVTAFELNERGYQAEDLVPLFQVDAAAVRAVTNDHEPKVVAIAIVRPPLSHDLTDEGLINITRQILTDAIATKIGEPSE